jgi:hypothetical protein
MCSSSKSLDRRDGLINSSDELFEELNFEKSGYVCIVDVELKEEPLLFFLLYSYCIL